MGYAHGGDDTAGTERGRRGVCRCFRGLPIGGFLRMEALFAKSQPEKGGVVMADDQLLRSCLEGVTRHGG